MLDFGHTLLVTDLTTLTLNILILYWDPVHKNNMPVCLAVLSGWVILNTEKVGLSTPNTDVMQSQKIDTLQNVGRINKVLCNFRCILPAVDCIRQVLTCLIQVHLHGKSFGRGGGGGGGCGGGGT